MNKDFSKLDVNDHKNKQTNKQTNKQGRKQTKLTAELNPYEVLESQVFQEDSRGSTSLEVEGDVNAQCGLQGGEVQVRGLLVEGRRIPQRSYMKIEENTSIFSF